MRKNIIWIAGGFLLGVLATAYCMQQWMAYAQQTERPGNSLDNPIDVPRDLSGLSIKIPRIRVVHTTDPWQEGGSMYLQEVDPWLGYMWGKNLTQRNFRERDGVYGDNGKLVGPLLPDGATKMMDRSHTSSCGTCHNSPYRDGGAGATIPKNGATGRNTPHMFGGGLVEMIGTQIRLQAYAIADTNRDGWISKEEAKGKRLIIYNLPEGDPNRVAIDLGSFEENEAGYPDLNPIISPVFVDKNGQRIASARSLKSPEVAGYQIDVQVFGWGNLYMPFRPPVQTTLRAFTSGPFDIHAGLQAHDPTSYTSLKRDAHALVSNAGAQQFITQATKDRGGVRAPTKTGLPGISLDDPDRDGYCEEISEGDLDVAEWYLLNHPSPTRAKITAEVSAGEKLFAKVGCTSCHLPDWHLLPSNPKAKDYTESFAGDRRFFDVKVAFNDKTDRLEGKIDNLTNKITTRDRKGVEQTRSVPRRGAYTIRGIYSDFKYHDVGEAFYQMQFDGSIVKKWKTAPLWGVGHTAPYGHDGASLDLDSVIRRHGGESLDSRIAYTSLSDIEQRQLIAFLNNLVLYQTDQLPCDLHGRGKIEENYKVQGMNTGMECFNPEWLFKIPVKIEGPIRNIRGERIVSRAGVNIRAAYGLDLEFLRDTDGDGFPDVIDPEPFIRGYRDGVR
jgi:cytochrome c peroxidase